MDIQNQVPRLAFDSRSIGRSFWSLSVDYPLEPDCTIELQIRYYHDDDKNPSHYRFGFNDMGDFNEVVTEEEFTRRYQLVLDNEGEAKARQWLDSNIVTANTFTPLASTTYSTCQELITRWEAMLALKLFNPAINL